MRRLLLVLALLTLPCPAGAATATLTWDAYTPSDGFAIRIETAPAPEGPFLPLASVPATVATYIDTTVRTGALACYRLQAIRQRDEADTARRQLVYAALLRRVANGGPPWP